MFRIRGRRSKAIGKWLLCGVLTGVSLYILYVATIWFLISKIIYSQNLEDTSAKNARGDEVFAETNIGGGETHPWPTVIWMKRSGHLFSTTLVKANSFDVLVGLQWRDNDHLVVQLDFGCDGTRSKPVEAVGPIHVRYRFGDPGHLPPVGYESAPRPDPSQPCD